MPSSDPYLDIYSTARLRALGLSTHAVRREVSEGRLTRIRPGWFHGMEAAPDVITAVRVGGILTATSGSPYRRLWTLGDDRIHVLLPRHTSRALLDQHRAKLGTVCVHWAKGRIARATPVAAPLQILVDSAHCQSRETAVALADSALNQQFVRIESLESVIPDLARWCDAASQSGTESLVRVRLRRRGVKLRSQVAIDGVGSVDFVVGDRLVIECDSAAHHDGYQSERDYQRDQALLRLGYLVLRLKYGHVIHDWDRIEALVLEIVRARRHMWRSGGAGSVVAL